jgi:hypothetical protein
MLRATGLQLKLMSTIHQIIWCVPKGALAGIILAPVLFTPVSAFELRLTKFIDTFEQPYPAKQVLALPSPEGDTLQLRLGEQETQSPQAGKRKKAARATRAISPKRSKSRLLAGALARVCWSQGVAQGAQVCQLRLSADVPRVGSARGGPLRQ